MKGIENTQERLKGIFYNQLGMVMTIVIINYQLGMVMFIETINY